MKFKWVVESESPQHLRTFLVHKRISRALLKSIKFNGGQILVDGEPTRTNAMINKGAVVEVTMPPEPGNPHVGLSNKPIDICYEDDDYLIVNKPPFLPTVQSAANQNDTLVNRVKNYYNDQQYESQVVHVVTRLDQDTSGLVIFAKHRFAHSILDQELQGHTLIKKYQAIINGHLSKKHGLIDGAIQRDPDSFIKRQVSEDGTGRASLTEYWVQEEVDDSTLVQVQLHSGRTHQIRVHFSHLNHPLVGDVLYGAEPIDELKRQALNCYYVSFFNVFSNRQVEVTIDIPADMLEYLESEKE